MCERGFSVCVCVWVCVVETVVQDALTPLWSFRGNCRERVCVCESVCVSVCVGGVCV